MGGRNAEQLLGYQCGRRVLGKPQALRGMTLIELMVGIAIVAILFTLAAPSFSTWIQGTHIRTAAEAIQNGLMLTRAEAVQRNTQVRFQLTDTLDDSCALSTTGTNWVLSLDDPSGACASAPSNTSAPRIIQTRAGAEGSKNAIGAAGQSVIVFNGLGRVTPVPAGNINIDISNPIGGACAADVTPGPMRCLRVEVSTLGQVRMCDPAFVFSNASPQGC
jgi:type IV fimbrial biogenesis protein FimT